MCDPVSLTVGLLGGALVNEQRQARKASSAAAAAQAESQPDPAAERAAAEAEAQQRANQRLAEDGRRRRDQQSLIAKGAPQPTLGDVNASPDSLSPIGGSTTRARPGANTRTSLISMGAAPAAAAPRPISGGGGGSRYNEMAY